MPGRFAAIWLFVLTANLALAGLALIATAEAARETDYGRYHALVIGNNEYSNLDNLKTAVNDARVVADVLRRDYGFEVELLLNANRYEIITALNELRENLAYDDNLLIYYAGHGVLEETSDIGYWLPVDAEKNNNANWIPNSTVTGLIATIPAKHILVVADSCYSGTLSRGVEVKLRTGAEQDEWIARMAQKKSRTLMSSGGLEPVKDSGGGSHSVFARPFIEALRSNRKIVDTDALFQEFKRKVIWNAKQTPRYDIIREAGHDGGDFLFVPLKLSSVAADVAPRQAAPASTADLEITFWNSIKDDDDPAMFEAYLEQFPNGTFAGLARRKIEKLRASETEVASLSPPEFKIEPLDRQMTATGNANIRAGPGTSYDRLETLKSGDEVNVTGRTQDGEWYRLALAGGRVGYVFRNLLQEKRAGPRIGETFRDCPECPEMVIVPAGSFMMGSPESEVGRREREGPLHRVSVRQPFAIGKYEVTRGQFAAFVDATGRKSDGCWVYDGEWTKDSARNWRSPGYAQTDENPVVCVSHGDAKAYTKWLSGKSGHAYRLPSEAEWEYSARANTRSARYWGASEDDACGYANVNDRTSKRVNNFSWASHDCDDGFAQTSPVGRFKANPFGLHDMLGNVWEWTEDCWNESYAGAPSDTNVWKAGDCDLRVLRGGSWVNSPRSVRSAIRSGVDIGNRNFDFGFRVARTPP